MVDTIRFASAKAGAAKAQLACNDARNDLCNRMGQQYAFHRTHFNNHAAAYNSAAQSASGVASNVAKAGCPKLSPQGSASVSWS